MKDRIEELKLFLKSVKNIEEYMYEEDGEWWVTNEWLCGGFAGRAFTDTTLNGALEKLISYFDEHIGHKSMVGNDVTKSGWPNLLCVKRYIAEEEEESA